MSISNVSPGSQASQLLMQASNVLKSITSKQIHAVNNEVSQAKTMQTNAQILSSAAKRKENAIDLMV